MIKVVVFLRSGNKIVLSTDAPKNKVVESCLALNNDAFLQVINVAGDTVILKVSEVEAIHIIDESQPVPD